VASQAALDPVNGRPLIEEVAGHRFRLTDEAAVRQAKWDREHGRGHVPMAWLDRTADPEPGPGYDSGRWKLRKMGVRV